MATFDDVDEKRTIWRNVAIQWYEEAVDKDGSVGRLHHHLTVLCDPGSLKQLSLFARSLTSLIPYKGAEKTMMVVFKPFLESRIRRSTLCFKDLLLCIHLGLSTFTRSKCDMLDSNLDRLDTGGLYAEYLLDPHSKPLFDTAYIAVSNLAALSAYGTDQDGSLRARLRLAYERNCSSDPTYSENISAEVSLLEIDVLRFRRSSQLVSRTFRITLVHLIESAVLDDTTSIIHIHLVFIWNLTLVRQAGYIVGNDLLWDIFERDIPWVTLCAFLNKFDIKPYGNTRKGSGKYFPRLQDDQPLPKDFILEGQMYSKEYFPPGWFADKYIRRLQMSTVRENRIRWLATRIAAVGISYQAYAAL